MPTYKQVGADENGDFPPRVEARLATKFSASADNGSDTDWTYYVAKWGSDSNDGRKVTKPLLTLGAAVAKQPPLTGTFGSTRRGMKIVMGPGDYVESALTINRAANLQIVGVGGRGGATAGAYGGTNIFTPLGGIGLTIGYRNDANTSWLNSKSGVVLRDLQFRPNGTDPGSSTAIKIIGLSNCVFENVTVANYDGTSSIGWHAQSNLIANGGSGGATMYNEWYSCTVSKTKLGFYNQGGSDAVWVGGIFDGQDDLVGNYLTSSKGVLCESGSGFTGFGTRFQALETAIDQSQSHAAGTVYQLHLYKVRMESCKVGVISNQLQTSITGGTYYSGGLSAGTSGTIAFQMLAGAEFSLNDVWIGGCETHLDVVSGAKGFRRDAQTGVTYYGSDLRGKINKYGGTTEAGSTPTGVIGGNAGTGATWDGFTAGSTDMAGEFKFTTGTSPGSGTMATISFANALPSGAIPLVMISRIGSINNTVMLVNSPTNTGFSIVYQAAPSASTQYRVQYFIAGVL
jgi:hypothetical protein